MLCLKKVSKQYGAVWAVREVSLELERGEALILLGPSGSGKTTILKMLAGLEIPTAGEIWVNGREMSEVPPHRRGLGMVFQNYALFPHMKVRDNIAFPLRMRGELSASRIAEAVMDILRLVRLDQYADRYPRQLSGGQQQRVALARALVFNPPLVLMDEPLGALDKKLRGAMQLEIKRIHRELNLTLIYVTHDQEEALTLADRIAVINNGRIEQLDSPDTVYEYPANPFVADFIGESNVLLTTVVERNDQRCLLGMDPGGTPQFSYAGPETGLPDAGQQISFVVRPEKMLIAVELNSEVRKLEGRIENVVYLGDTVKYVVNVEPDCRLALKQQVVGKPRAFGIGTRVQVGWHDDDCRLMPVPAPLGPEK
jgi:spermidine/putrescine ABC transporter ATP-binding subunit